MTTAALKQKDSLPPFPQTQADCVRLLFDFPHRFFFFFLNLHLKLETALILLQSNGNKPA